MCPRLNESNGDVSAMLIEWGRDRDRVVLDRLLPLIYAELQKQAHRFLGREQHW